MSDMTVYGTPMSPFTRSIRMALEEKEEDYRLYPYAPGSDEMKHEHPMGKVPAIRDADVHLFETLPALIYIDDEYPTPRLQPRDSIDKAEMFQWISLFLDSGYQYLGRGIVFERLFAPRMGMTSNEQAIQEVLPRAEMVLAAINKGLRGKSWFVNDEMSLADILWAPGIFYFKRTPEGQQLLSKFEHVNAWYTNISSTASFKKTEPDLST